MSSIDPLVSVIVTCYNQAHFLDQSIESVLKQTYKNFELIVVDDGSKDNPSEVANRYPITKFVSQKNQGTPAGTRNTGFRHSKGEYLIFLDADDRLLPNALETGVNCMTDHPGCGFVSGHHTYISYDGSPIPKEPQTRVEKDFYLSLLKWQYVWIPAVLMFSRKAFESVGGFNASKEMKGVDDHDICLKIGARFPIYCHNTLVAEYRLHGNNTSRDMAMMLQSSVRVFHANKHLVKGNREYEETFKLGFRRCLDSFGDDVANQIRARVSARRELKEALRGSLYLLRYHPRGFFAHLYRKIYCSIFGVRETAV
jgi:glycosyltransferase involved in cell wall biosynthesis